MFLQTLGGHCFLAVGDILWVYAITKFDNVFMGVCQEGFCFSPTAEALGSSAIVKVSEQTGAAPKPIPTRFQSQGSQVKVPKKRFPSKGSQVKVPKRRFPSKGSQVKVPK